MLINTATLTPEGFKDIEVAKITYQAPYFVLISKNLVEIPCNREILLSNANITLGDNIKISQLYPSNNIFMRTGKIKIIISKAI